MAKLSRPRIRWQGHGIEQESGEALLKGDIEQNLLPESHHLAVSNNLLASLGKQGRDNLHLLSQLESNEVEAFVDLDSQSLLPLIQQDMLDLNQYQDDTQLNSSHHKPMLPLGDDSISLHSCHSPTREVEVLYDQLLHMFNADPQLKPKDIIVMVSDINAYAPVIQAVFGNAPFERRIPFSISDRTASQESPVLNAFMQLLNLPNSRFERGRCWHFWRRPRYCSVLGSLRVSSTFFPCGWKRPEFAGAR
ncbi:exodeoxyribonuclease V gamma chain [Vibrio ishigakensis]|uniref:Exodeoxyribonuclease V gamma chain n=1 Tax=Vibrio ishigakensis TaxID=1481914 RepID=A0A0B8QN47_9VIBR|nr:exodeoxyribonuclease V gamma chain [Vibrio ishigakensis]